MLLSPCDKEQETMYLSVITVKPLQDYKIELTFENNEVKIFDMKNYLETGAFKKTEGQKII